MNRSVSMASTSTSEQPKLRSFFNTLYEWILVWWPAVMLFFALITAGITRYIFPQQVIYELMIQLIKAIGVIMAVFYVIYTRVLALETKKMALASIGMFNSEKGTVLTELIEGNCNFGDMCDDAKSITHDIHIHDKKLSEKEFSEIISQRNLPAIFVRIKNRSGRRIDPSKIEYSARHTGSDNKYDITCNISRIGNIGPWEDLEVFLIASPEGEVEISLTSIDYVDGGIVQRKSNLDNVLVLERIRKPEKVRDAEN